MDLSTDKIPNSSFFLCKPIPKSLQLQTLLMLVSSFFILNKVHSQSLRVSLSPMKAEFYQCILKSVSIELLAVFCSALHRLICIQCFSCFWGSFIYFEVGRFIHPRFSKNKVYIILLLFLFNFQEEKTHNVDLQSY